MLIASVRVRVSSSAPSERTSPLDAGAYPLGVGANSGYHVHIERKWRSGSASPCQGEGRGFESLLPLQRTTDPATWPSGKAGVCKTLITGSNPVVASTSSPSLQLPVPLFTATTALIVVDIQNDFAHPSGSLHVPGAEAVIASANRLLSEAASASAVIIYTQDWHPLHTPHFVSDGGIWPVHCVGNSWGARFHEELFMADAPVVRKGVDGADGYSGFTTRDPQSGDQQPTTLEARLRDASIRRCVIIGLATDYCVKETALDAQRLDFETIVAREAVAAVNLNPGDGERACSEMALAGIQID